MQQEHDFIGSGHLELHDKSIQKAYEIDARKNFCIFLTSFLFTSISATFKLRKEGKKVDRIGWIDFQLKFPRFVLLLPKTESQWIGLTAETAGKEPGRSAPTEISAEKKPKPSTVNVKIQSLQKQKSKFAYSDPFATFRSKSSDQEKCRRRKLTLSAEKREGATASASANSTSPNKNKNEEKYWKFFKIS